MEVQILNKHGQVESKSIMTKGLHVTDADILQHLKDHHLITSSSRRVRCYYGANGQISRDLAVVMAAKEGPTVSESLCYWRILQLADAISKDTETQVQFEIQHTPDGITVLVVVLAFADLLTKVSQMVIHGVANTCLTHNDPIPVMGREELRALRKHIREIDVQSEGFRHLSTLIKEMGNPTQ